MVAKLYHHEDPSVYILELDGNIINPQAFQDLGNVTKEIAENSKILNLIIYQGPEFIKITSGGLEQIIALCANVQNRSTIVFADVRNSLKKLLVMTKLYDKYPQYKTLEEAISHYSR